MGLIRRACDSSRGRVSRRGLNRQEGQCTALGRRPQNRASGTVPRTGKDRKGEVVTCRPRASPSSSRMGGMSGQLCQVCVLFLRFVSVGRSGWPVLVSCRSWLLPGYVPVSFRFLRECFSLTSDTDKGAHPITVHFCQVCPGYYCSGSSWAASSSLSPSGYCRLFSVPLGSPFFGVLAFFVRQWLQL